MKCLFQYSQIDFLFAFLQKHQLFYDFNFLKFIIIFFLQISYFEIYMEKIRDLLDGTCTHWSCENSTALTFW